MSADLLRKAAREMRERAEYAPESPWAADVHGDGRAWVNVANEDDHAWGMHGFPAAARHVASWHPAVALAVADWLEEEADAWSEEGGDGLPYFRAYMVAVTYLGTGA